MHIGILFAILIVVLVVIVFFTKQPSSEYLGTCNTQPTRLRATNHSVLTLWIQQENLLNDPQVIKLKPNESYDYTIPDSGVAAVRLWPKTHCDETGNNCKTGQSIPPCPVNGCQPPFESKAEFTFADIANPNSMTAYDVSFVDGYTLPISIVAKGDAVGTGVCKTLDCSQLTLDKCPFENLNSSNIHLRASDACLSPCQKSVQPPPWGLGVPVDKDPSLRMCCPTPCKFLDCKKGNACNCAATSCELCAPNVQCTWENSCATSDSCSDINDPKSVVNTNYYKTIKSICPNAYAYAYDDNPNNKVPVLMFCPAVTQFEVVFYSP